MPAACHRSLERLGIETIDLYLLHWSGAVPLAETVQAFEALQREGKIRHWGVSNLDPAEMEALWATPGGSAAQTDQVLFNLGRRGIEWDLQPWLRRQRIPVMAYSPIEQGRLLRQRALLQFAKQRAMTPAQAALAWLLAQDGVIAIPKTGSRARLEENAGALAQTLTPADLRELDRSFPPPHGPSPLAMI
jgi:aldehyde reductase